MAPFLSAGFLGGVLVSLTFDGVAAKVGTWDHLEDKKEPSKTMLPQNRHHLQRLEKNIGPKTASTCSQRSKVKLPPASTFRGERKVVHMHIHNAGGTFLCSKAGMMGEFVMGWPCNCNLRNVYGRLTDGPFSRVVHNNATCADRQAEMDRQNVSFSMIERWIEHGTGDWCGKKFVYTVTVRDPVERGATTTKVNFQNRSGAVLSLLRRAEATRLPVRKGWLHSHAAFDNTMIRLLNGVEAMVLPIGGINKTHLQRAMHMLQKFDVVLDLPNITRDHVQLTYALGWQPLAPPRQKKKTKTRTRQGPPRALRSTVAPELSDKLTRLNALDMELYRYGQALAIERSGTARRVLGLPP